MDIVLTSGWFVRRGERVAVCSQRRDRRRRDTFRTSVLGVLGGWVVGRQLVCRIASMLFKGRRG